MKNPFVEHNSVEKNIKTGFYYDTVLKQITFIYENEEYGFFSPKYSCYSRTGLIGNFQDLIELSKVQDCIENLEKEFEWIDTKNEVHNYFYKFLHDNQMFRLLERLKEVHDIIVDEEEKSIDVLEQEDDFKIGDYIKARGNHYTITSKEEDFLGVVININKDKTLKVEVIFHNQEEAVGNIYDTINPEYMKKFFNNTNLKNNMLMKK